MRQQMVKDLMQQESCWNRGWNKTVKVELERGLAEWGDDREGKGTDKAQEGAGLMVGMVHAKS